MGKNNLIFGIHPLIEALEAGREIDKILLKRGLRSSEVSHIMDVAKERTIPVQIVPEERLTRLTRKQHQGVIAFISEIEYTQLDQLIPMLYEEGRSPFVVLIPYYICQSILFGSCHTHPTSIGAVSDVRT